MCQVFLFHPVYYYKNLFVRVAERCTRECRMHYVDDNSLEDYLGNTINWVIEILKTIVCKNYWVLFCSAGVNPQKHSRYSLIWSLRLCIYLYIYVAISSIWAEINCFVWRHEVNSQHYYFNASIKRYIVLSLSRVSLSIKSSSCNGAFYTYQNE